ncbi:MAG: RagB/SusD family nutrient uptake outer membrane protein, partial [Bacteroidales bacterium]|nr:RagB/SusD family nutrient uptake outer membrane protein [Bacteroidales bacterium]
MKAIKYISALAGTAILLSSCFAEQNIDLSPVNYYDEAVVYASDDNLDLYVKSFYGVLYANADIANGYIFDDGVTDLVKYSWWGTNGGTVNQFFYLGDIVTPEANFRSNWSSMYTYIRQINELFFDVHLGYADKLDAEALKVRIAECRFLRAFAYQELILRHGGVILRMSEDSVDGPNEKAKARSSEEESWDFVIKEYDKAAAVLPASWTGADAGRATKGAALGMKARAALYAGRWQEAYDAADSVITSGTYSLVAGSAYNSIFSNPFNTEIILPVYYKESSGNAAARQHNFNSYFCPPGDGAAFNVSVGAAATPTDEYAGFFDIKVGSTWQKFDWDNLAAYGNKPFDNRDPRFYASILYNGATWRGRTLQLYDGGTDGFMTFKTTGQDNDHRSTTGYIFRKFLSDAAGMNYTSILSGQTWIEMRLAEIYLIRSEAAARLNACVGAYKDLNEIRSRVGMDPLPRRGNWNAYLEDLSKERVCELGLEGHRYFDLIRWG